MTAQVRRVAGVMLVLFGALFVNLNVIQVLRAGEFANHPNNRRLLIQEYGIERGPIVVGDTEIAFSEPTDGALKYRRRYAESVRYAHLVGYHSLIYGRSGLEATFNEELTGTPSALLGENLAELLGERDPVGNTVRLTINARAQATAMNALDGRTGAVVAVDPRTGEVLVHVSSPSFDPEPLASHDGDEARAYWQRITENPDQPLADRARARRYQPGSAFKIVVAAAALERGIRADTAFDDTDAYTPPQTDRPIRNFGRGNCAGGGSITLEQSFVVSCNVVFAKLGVDLGADAIVSQAERFGFNREVPYEVRPVAPSVIPSDLDPPSTAHSAIGMRDVQATALHMAMMAAAVANDGVLMRPHVVAEVLDSSGRRIRGARGGPWVEGRMTAQAISPETARSLVAMMVRAVEDGTGRNAQIAGARVGGKTGTADPGGDQPSHAWFVGFAGPGGESPNVAVAVVLPSAGMDATGGRDAAPVARAVMETLVPWAAIRDTCRPSRTPKMSSFRGGSVTPGEQVRLGDRYLLEHLIGQGGMAEVWSARDLVLERDVAVKLLLPRFREDNEFRARFRREAQHSAKLNHAHIVAVYDTGVHDGLPFIVMERVTGRSLQDVLSHGGLTEERSLEICADVCAALENAHRRSLVHRDVKPGNILIADDGMVKVTDFGIARALDSETITQTVAVLGTAAYLSPEQAQGAVVDERSDIYSLGIVLYEMLTGRQPFQGDTAVGVAYQHVQEVPPPLREWDPTISPAAEAITMKALSKNPANRYASAQDMREDILRAQADQPVTAPAVMSPDETAVIDADVTRARPPLTDTQERRRHVVGYAMLALLTIAAFAAGIWLLASVLDREETLLRTVPEVIGQAPQAAQTMLEARGLEGRFVGESHSASIPKGRVLGQNPDPGMQVADGSIVELTLSAGPEPVTVPAVEGEAEQDAIVILREAGLTVGDREDEYSDDIPSGHAIGTNPPAGRTVERGSSVTLIVSAGEESEFVPNVEGLLESDARFQLEDRGFRVLIVSEHSDNVDEGRVIRQEPSGNTRERVGSEVTIVVSLGPEEPDEPEPEPEPDPPDEEEPPPDEDEPPPDDGDDEDGD